jgi:hypothetical protein
MDVQALWDDELPPERAEQVRAHAHACSGCRSELRSLQRYAAALRDGDPVEAVPALVVQQLKHDLLRRASEDLRSVSPTPAVARRRPWTGWLWLAGGAAAGATALAVAVAVPHLLQRAPDRLPKKVAVRPPVELPQAPEAVKPATVPDEIPRPRLAGPSPRPKPDEPARGRPVFVSAERPTARLHRDVSTREARAARETAPAPTPAPAPRRAERLVIDVETEARPAAAPSGSLTLVATGSGSGNASLTILRTVDEENP